MGAQASTPQQQQQQQNVVAAAGTALSLPFLSSSAACLIGTLIFLVVLFKVLGLI